MASLKLFYRRLGPLLRWSAYLLVAGFFLWICAQFYIPGKGFTYLIRFGEKESVRYIPALRAINHYEEEDSHGYDAQYYAQIAMHPWLDSTELAAAVDNLPYRARRILFPWLANVLALGDPALALHIFAVQNIICWLILAVLLLRWFPPNDWGNFARWVGVLFSSGLCLSVHGALVDGPSLLLIAWGVALLEKGRTWWSALLLGVAGLGKETNLLAALALPWPKRWDFREWLKFAGRGLLVVLPLALWFVLLTHWIAARGEAGGMRNFAAPFAGYVEKWRETMGQLRTEGIGSVAQWNALSLISLTAQWLFLVLRPRWRDPWWRVGIAYCVLMVFLGSAVWENYPGASSRVLLPMVLAFNILVPKSRNLGWWLVLILGNLTVVFSSDFLKPPGREDFQVSGVRELIMVAKSGETVEARFKNAEWFQPERSRFEFWRWSRGSSTIALHNPQPFAVVADVSFGLKSSDERNVTVLHDEQTLWQGVILRAMREVRIRGVLLPPGDTYWKFETNRPAQYPANGDPRLLAFSLRNLKINVIGRESAPRPEVTKP